MSHVVGQGGIASNHYRTSEYRASQYQTPQEFNSETLEFNSATGAARKSILKNMKDKLIPAFRNYDKSGAAAKRVKNWSDEDFANKFDEILDLDNFDELVGDGVTKKQWLRDLLNGDVDPASLNRIAQSLEGDNLAKRVIPDLTQDSVRAAKRNGDDLVDNAVDAAGKPLSDGKKTFMRYGLTGATVVTSIAVFMGFGGNEALQKWIDNTTGMNCGEKAEDQGMEVGSAQYQTAVADCQQGVADNLLKLGYGALAIVGFVGLIAVTRAIPKRKAKKEEPEEEEEDATEAEE
jgi:hypothetical protein